MKIAISASGTTLDALVDPRFGRCPYFVIIETDDMSMAALPNQNASLQGGAGIQAARFVADNGVGAVLTGRCGPNALLALASAGIPLYEAVGDIPISKAVEKFKNNVLTPSSGGTAQLPESQFVTGMRQGKGMGERGLASGGGRRGQGRRGGNFFNNKGR